MKDHSIILHPETVREILAGSTSIVVRMNPQPYRVLNGTPILEDFGNPVPYPEKYRVGDRIMVRETWKYKSHNFPTGLPFEYRATAEQDGTPTHGPWKSPACMPREAVRLVLEIRHIVCQKSPGGYFWRIEFFANK